MKEHSTNSDPSQQPPPTLDEVWRLFRDASLQIKETDRQIKETGLQLKETDLQLKETDLQLKETGLQLKETDRQFKEMVAESKRTTAETGRQFKETDKKLNKLEYLFTSHWGRLMESLVEGDLVNILNRRGIAIDNTSSRLRGRLKDGGNYEFDILAHNGDEIVVVEVKTTLRPDDVNKFRYKLNHFKDWLPRYANNRIYGAMAYLTADAGAETMAANRGLFIIRATGDSAAIINDEGFQPRCW